MSKSDLREHRFLSLLTVNISNFCIRQRTKSDNVNILIQLSDLTLFRLHFFGVPGPGGGGGGGGLPSINLKVLTQLYLKLGG